MEPAAGCSSFELNFVCVQTHGREILQLFQDVFSLLPIATVIDGKILIVHGGISDQTDLDSLSTIERHKVSGDNHLDSVTALIDFGH